MCSDTLTKKRGIKTLLTVEERQQEGQRAGAELTQLVDHALVELGLLAKDLEVDFLAPLPREVADHALEAVWPRGGPLCLLR